MSMVWLLILAAVLIIGWLAWSLKRSTRRVTAAAQRSDSLERNILELEEGRRQSQTILESMVEGVCALDGEGRIFWLNGSARRLFRINAGQTTGRRLLDVFRQPELEALIRETLERREPTSRELQILGPEERVMRFQTAPCEGGLTGAALVLVVQDVTEMRRLEGMRREFVANVSHELKTPLTSIRSLVETLLGGALEDPSANRRFLSLIDEDARRLTRLIDDLLELSKIESNAVPLNLAAVPLAPLVESVVASCQAAISRRRLQVRLQLPAGLAARADSDRLRQVFVNLINNAIEYNTEGGTITVSAERGTHWLTVTVADTGIGIPQADLSRVFERFYRVDKARSRESGGTGLGLAIVKHIVEAHGGSVSVTSHPGTGSSFSVTLPLSA